MAVKAFCVHAHFYQPPREDPITGLIPNEAGAAPFRNWNERIHSECYRPNADLGNFGKISFNVGPTLLNWISEYDPPAYRKIVVQDLENYNTHGVGNAMAQAYHHTILPLGSRADKITQVRWGLANFEHHFGHKPAGLWMPETAVDTETLVVLADCGIQFTILAPWQIETSQSDPGSAYLIDLPGGRSISVFVYDQDLSTRISFDPGATINADVFAGDILSTKYPTHNASDITQKFLMVSSDGELYGHHQPFRDKFLQRLLSHSIYEQKLELAYPGLWLKLNPPIQHATILENSSWSCHHGVKRWMGECGCTPGSKWKAPLRRALNRLAAALDKIYLEATRPYAPDPWELRHAYIDVRLGKLDVSELVYKVIGQHLDYDELRRFALLLDAQYERQRMFTSCGWYFDDFDRIEPRNNIAYAAQAVWLTKLATGIDLTGDVLAQLKNVSSQRSGLKGDAVFTTMYRKISSSYETTDPALKAFMSPSI